MKLSEVLKDVSLDNKDTSLELFRKLCMEAYGSCSWTGCQRLSRIAIEFVKRGFDVEVLDRIETNVLRELNNKAVNGGI